MMRVKKKLINILCAVSLVTVMMSGTAYANSAPVHIEDGETARGIIPLKKSPLIVEKEILTFDIPHLLPEEIDYDIDGALERSGTVTAEYYVQNPTDEEVTIGLAFAHGADRENTSCEVRLDDEKLDTKVRYTYLDEDEQFWGPSDVKMIRDGFKKDTFFYPEMPVTEYRFYFTGISDTETTSVVFDYDIPDETKTRIMIPCSLNWTVLNTKGVRNGDTISVYVFGDTDGMEMSWEMEGKPSVLPEKAGEMSLQEFAALSTESIPDICEEDGYNVVVDGMNAYEQDNLIYSFLPEYSYSTTMWFEYEYTLGPKEEAVNTVKAILAPEIFNYRKKPEYIYKYLLSPAHAWKSFGTLDVIIHTPHPFYDDSDGFETTEQGYEKHFDTLPTEELSFSLTPKKSQGSGGAASGDGTFTTFLGAVFGKVIHYILVFSAAIFGIGAVVVGTLLIKSRK